MKNTKLIGLVALLVVVVLVVSVVIATSADKANMKPVTDKLTAYEQQLAQITKTLEEVRAGLKNANQALEDLKAAGVIIEDFDKATAEIFNKIDELDAEVDKIEDAEGFSWNAYAQHTIDEKDQILEDAYFAITRATSVEAMDKIIADAIKAIKALPTKVQEYITLVDAIGETGELTDKDNIVKVVKMGDIPENAFEGADAAAKAATKKTYTDKFDKAYGEYLTAAKKAFVDAVKALPTVALLKIEDEDACMAAALLGAHLYETGDLKDAEGEVVDFGLGLTMPTTGAEFDALEALKKLSDRHDLLVTAKEKVTNWNKTLADFFKTVTFGTNDATLNQLEKLDKEYEDLIADLVKDLTVVLDETKLEHNAYVWGWIDHASVKGWHDKYTTAKADLQKLADAYLAAVKALGTETEYAKIVEAKNAAFVAWANLAKKVGSTSVAVDADKYLEYKDGDDADTLPDNGVQVAKAAYDVISVEIDALISNVNTIKNFLTVTIHDVVCQKPTEHTGAVACDCTVRSKEYNANLTWTAVKALVEKNLKPILSTARNFKADVIGADVLADLKAAYIAAAEKAILANYESWKGTVASNVASDVKTYLDKVVLDEVKALTVDFAIVATTDATTSVTTYAWAEAYNTVVTTIETYASAAYLNTLVK